MRKLFALAILLSVLAPAAQAATYQIHLTGGTMFTTRYAPVLAEFDPGLMMFMSDQANWVSLKVELVSEIIVLEEALGFGTVIDDKTLMIGFTVNDNLSPEEQAELEATLGPEEFRLPYSDRLPFSEPNARGGIPLGFLNMNTPPMGGVSGGSGRGLAGNRRAGGGMIVEPSNY